jgi:hypothetical protein
MPRLITVCQKISAERLTARHPRNTGTTSVPDALCLPSRRWLRYAVTGESRTAPHWVLDVAFCEDDCRVRAGNAAANFSAVRQFALGLLKKRTEAKCGIKIRRQRAGWENKFLLQTIGLQLSD